MPPRRARSASVSSASGAPAVTGTPRRSSRVSQAPPPNVAPKNPPKKVVKGRGKRAASVASDISEEEDEESEEDGEESTSASGGKKRKAPSSSKGAAPKKKTTAAARAIKPKPRRTPITGLNPLSSRFELFPSHSAFPSLSLPALLAPEIAPRAVFVFGNGDMGQHGLGVDVLDEIKRPRRQATVQKKIDEREQGWEGGVADLVAGGMHTLAVDGEGRVWSWGINDNAALGRVTTIPDVEAEELETNPMMVEGLSSDQEDPFKAVRVAAGDSVSLAISEEGEVRAWGSFRASEGLLGFDGSAGSSLTQLHPTALKNLEKHTVVQIACGDDHFLALTSTGFVFACGNGEQNQLGRKIVQRHKTHGLTPERLALKNIVLVGSGSYHSFAVDKSGEVYAWGLNSYHQTGVSDDDGGWADVISTPTIVSSLSPSEHGGAKVVQIVGGTHHSLFLFDNGEVWACGRSDGHEVGLKDDHPEMVESAKRKEQALKERAEREKEELAARHGEDGTTVTAMNEDGKTLTSEQAALAAQAAAAKGVPLPNDYVPVPVRIVFPLEPKENDPALKADDFDSDVETEETQIVQLAAGTRHNFAVSARGYVYSWGVGTSSQLGQGNVEEVDDGPRRIWNTALSNVRVVRAETGGQHSVVVGVDRDAEEKYEVRRKQQEEEAKQKKEEEEAAAKKAAEDSEGEKMEVDADAAKPNGDDEVKENGQAASEEKTDGEESEKAVATEE
ncbi:hypothetical protein JCM1841_006285 [Sporobolomyces salmonicolor]